MKVDWQKRGFVYAPNGSSNWARSHAHKPTPLLVDADTLRVYFGVRSADGKTRTTYIDVDPYDPSKVKAICNRPILDLGKLGAFDDSGANVCSIVDLGDTILMYFIGWNPGTTVHTRNSIGLAISHDRGLTFRRMFDGAILDRNKEEPYYTGAVDVLKENNRFKMWYTSGTGWELVNEKPEIKYHIKYAESDNGIDWIRNGVSCIPPSHPFEATARPSVLHLNDRYLMWFSTRQIKGFRDTPGSMYRAGFAESEDGVNWERNDSNARILPSNSGWDSNAIAYPYVRLFGEQLLMLYNGNGFGKSGFGYMLGRIRDR